MTFSASRVAELKLDVTPSFLWSNLTCSQDHLAYSNRNSVVVLNSSALADLSLSPSSIQIELSPFKDGIVNPPNITQTSLVSLDCGKFLLVTSPTTFAVFDCSNLKKESGSKPEPLFRKELAQLDASILEGRKPDDHFFRGLAGPPTQKNILFVGTSWGAILAWRVESRSKGFEFSVFQVLTGGHSAPITSIVADERYGAGYVRFLNPIPLFLTH